MATAGWVAGIMFRYEICGNPPQLCPVTDWSGAPVKLAVLYRPDGSIVDEFDVWGIPGRFPAGYFFLDGGDENITGWKIRFYANMTSGPPLSVGEYLGQYIMPNNGGGPNYQWAEVKNVQSIGPSGVIGRWDVNPFGCGATAPAVNWDYNNSLQYPANGFEVDRNGAFVANVGADVRQYDDPNWQFGEAYSYSVRPYFYHPGKLGTIYGSYGQTPNRLTPFCYINGPTSRTLNQAGTWNVDGMDCPQYEWRVRADGIGSWSNVLGTSCQLIVPMPCCNSYVELKCTATSGARVWTGTYRVNLTGSPCVTPPTPGTDKIPAQEQIIQYALYPNHPNPFNPETSVEYQLAQDGNLSIRIYNTLGQEVRTLINDYQQAGVHFLRWDGRDNMGRELASGIYLLRMQAGTFVKTNRMMLLK